MINNTWTKPELISFSSRDSYGDGCPFMSPGGEVLYFSSFRALEKGSKSGRERIWNVKRQGDGWAEPQAVGQDVNIMNLHWQTSVSADRNLFFSTDQGMMRSRFVNGQHQKPERVEQVMHPKYIGGTPYIAPDESYFIFSSDKLPYSLGKRDLYIGYRKKNGTWTDPVHLGNIINTTQHDLCPIITYDGKYLLYLSWQDERPGVYWFPAHFIEELKPKELR
jgi:Tol biopolymer transport system component